MFHEIVKAALLPFTEIILKWWNAYLNDYYLDEISLKKEELKEARQTDQAIKDTDEELMQFIQEVTAEKRAKTTIDEIFEKFFEELEEECEHCANLRPCALNTLCEQCSYVDKCVCPDCADKDDCAEENDCDEESKPAPESKLVVKKEKCPYEDLRQFILDICKHKSLFQRYRSQYIDICNCEDEGESKGCARCNCTCAREFCSTCFIIKYCKAQEPEVKPEIKRPRLADLASKRIDLTADESDEEEEKEDDEAEADESSRRVRPRIEQATQEPEEEN